VTSPSAAPARSPTGTFDAAIATLIGVFFSLVYGALAWRVTQGHFFEHFNLVFDYDAPAFVDLFTHGLRGRADQVDLIGRAIKHPLASWISLLTLPFRLFGIRASLSAALTGAVAGGITDALFFLFARLVGSARPESILVTLIFAFGAAQLFPSILVESYVYAALTLMITWFLLALRYGSPARMTVAATLNAVLTFGVTITNAVQSAIAEFFAQFSAAPLPRAIRKTLLVGCAAAVLAVAAIAVTWPDAIPYAFAHPAMAVRVIYWQQTKGARTGLGQVLLTFFGYSLAAPLFTTVPLPEGILMRDFRAFEMPLFEAAGLFLWIVVVVASAVVAVADESKRKLSAALLAAIAFNIVLNCFVQYRGSLFIYTPHIWVAIAALVAVGISAWQPAKHAHRWILRGVLAAILLIIAPLNLARAVETVTLFDDAKAFTLPHAP